MRVKKEIIWVTVSIAVLILLFTFYCFDTGRNHKKYAYVQLETLRKDFVLSKQLDAELKNIVNKRKEILDSMKLDFQMLERRVQMKGIANKEDVGEYRLKRAFFEEKENEFVEANNELESKYQEDIWNKINNYIKDYGKENKYEYIFGLNGTGSVMYAEEENDITAPLLIYINDKYSGK